MKKQDRNHRKKVLYIITVGVLLLPIVFVLVVIKLHLPFGYADKSLEGKWAIDDVTVYEFEKGGEGAMILPTETYKFVYTLKKKQVYIDFESKYATDKNYFYEVEENTLLLTEKGKHGVSYTMKKIN